MYCQQLNKAKQSKTKQRKKIYLLFDSFFAN